MVSSSTGCSAGWVFVRWSGRVRACRPLIHTLTVAHVGCSLTLRCTRNATAGFASLRLRVNSKLGVMANSVVVRRAQESDSASLVALRKTIFGETEFMLWEPGEFHDTAEDEAKRIARLNAGQNSLCVVAEDGGTLVGFLNAMGGSVNRQRHSTRVALGVLRAHWGRGVASALLEEALTWSKRAGLVRVELTVHTTNLRAMDVYLRVGFQVEGVLRSSLLVAGRCVDEYVMSVINDA